MEILRNPYSLLAQTKRKEETAKEVTTTIDNILDNFVATIKNFKTFDKFDEMMLAIQVASYKIVALYKKEVGVGDTGTDEAIVMHLEELLTKRKIHYARKIVTCLYYNFHTNSLMYVEE